MIKTTVPSLRVPLGGPKFKKNYLLVKPDLNGWFLQKAEINYFKVEGLNPVRFGVREFDTVLIDKRVFGLNQPFRPPKGTVVYFAFSTIYVTYGSDFV